MIPNRVVVEVEVRVEVQVWVEVLSILSSFRTFRFAELDKCALN